MAPSVLALPVRVARVGGRLAKRLALPMIAVSLVRRVMQQRSPSSPEAPEPATSPTSRLRSVPEPTHEGAPVVDPVPLAEPAVDLDADVMLASELPIRSYDALAAADAENAIRELSDADEVRTVLRFEEENGKRDEVIAVAHERLEALGQSAHR